MSKSYRHGKYARHKRKPGDYYWLWTEPKSWRTMMKHKKRRSEWRMLKSKIYKGADMDDLTYPLDIKPWIYYW